MKMDNSPDCGKCLPVSKFNESLKQQVEQVLSLCEAAMPHVYVLEMMRILPITTKGKQKRFNGKKTPYNYFMLPIIDMVEKLALKIYHNPVTIDNGVMKRSVAVIARHGELENLELGGECLWLRKIDADELFETKDHWLLLQPGGIREIPSDFILDALKNHLTDHGNDAQLAVLHAASELLLEHLEEDIRLIPDRFDDVIQAIEEVLDGVDLFNLEPRDIYSFTLEVMRKVRL